jgi:hypothetical protein
MSHRLFTIIMIFVNLFEIMCAYYVNRLTWWHLLCVAAIVLMIVSLLLKEPKKQ